MAKKQSVISTGIVSLITFFTILILTSFTVLITASALNDRQLSDKTAESIKAYYEADAQAQEMLMELHTAYKNGLDIVTQSDTFRYRPDITGNGTVIEYEVPIDDNKILEVQAGFNPDGTYTLITYQILPTNI